jgi:hypothetical protein
MKGIRDIFRNASKLITYRLNDTTALPLAKCEFGEARFVGVRGNDLRVVITADKNLYTVRTMLENIEIDSQTVENSSDLKDNDFVVWKKTATLKETAGVPFTGGVNPKVNIYGYTNFLYKIETLPFNVLGTLALVPDVYSLFVDFTRKMRDKVGVKIQCVLYDYSADYEGIISIKNMVNNDHPASAAYWVSGLMAGCPVNKSNLNKVYDGEYSIQSNYTQEQLTEAINQGMFTFHRVGDDMRVLADINSLTTVSNEKSEIFKENQTIRVVDQIAIDIAALFNKKYLGSVPNDEAGRVSLWADIVKHHENLEQIRAIEDFKEDDVEVLPGDTKRSVIVKDKIKVTNAMAQVYMTCIIE